MVAVDPAPTRTERCLRGLGIVLPPPPTPLGAYVEAARSGNLVFLSGMLPVIESKAQFVGRVGGELGIEEGRKAAATALINGLSTAKAFLGSLDRITAIPKLGAYIATEGDFRDLAKVADGASELLERVFGKERLSSRVVLGVASLPLGVPIEIELVLEIDGANMR